MVALMLLKCQSKSKSLFIGFGWTWDRGITTCTCAWQLLNYRVYMLSHQSAILTLSFLSPSIEDKMKFTDSFPAPVNTEWIFILLFTPQQSAKARRFSQQHHWTGQSVWINSMNRLSFPKENLMCFRQLNVIDTKFGWKHCISKKRIAKVHNFSSFSALKYIFRSLLSLTSSHWIWRKL